MSLPLPKTVTFPEITRILEMTDRLELDRELIEIPLAAESPGKIHQLPNSKIEIIVDADVEFDTWLASAELQVRHLLGLAHG